MSREKQFLKSVGLQDPGQGLKPCFVECADMSCCEIYFDICIPVKEFIVDFDIKKKYFFYFLHMVAVASGLQHSSSLKL